MKTVIVDTNLLLLLIVGSAHRSYIAAHKRTQTYSEEDFDLLVQLIGSYSELYLLQSTLTEASNLARQIAEPARTRIAKSLGQLIEMNQELPVPSIWAVARPEYLPLGLTDALILAVCDSVGREVAAELVTADRRLATCAEMLDIPTIRWEMLP